MLDVIGVPDIEGLFRSIPSGQRSGSQLDMPEGLSELSLNAHMTGLAMKNRTMSCAASFLGAGAYRHYVPAAVAELASRSEFVTPYTPYQAEISQGTLQALFEYQSLICRLFTMDVSNASHYSAATATADAALMALRVCKPRRKIIVPANLHPEYRQVLSTSLKCQDDLRLVPFLNGVIDRVALKEEVNDNVAAIIAQFPNFFGIVEDLRDVVQIAHDAGALFVAVVPEPLALGILSPPGDWGTDIAVGEGLSFGLATSFGGPTLGIFAVRKEFVRQMPGRVCGKTVDADGKTGYVLTLSTREQHIRREKATSNICSNQALCATTAAIYLSMLGGEGMRELATINAANALYAREKLSQVPGVRLPFSTPTFNEFVIETPRPASEVIAALAVDGIFGGVALGRWYPKMGNRIIVCVTELNTKREIDTYAEKLAEIVRQ